MIKNCKNCNSSFETRISKRVFCKKECYGKSRIGKKRPAVGEKISNSLIGKKHTPERVEKIKKANQKNLDEKQKKKIIEFWNFGISDSTILKELKIGKKPFLRFKSEFFSQNELQNKNCLKFVTLEVSKLKEIIDLGRQKISYKRISKISGVSPKTTKKVLIFYSDFFKENLFYSYDNKTFHFKQTKIEKMVEDFLLKNEIAFEKEVVVVNSPEEVKIYGYRNFRYDFEILNKNIFLEINGDYWHANPNLFAKEALGDIQKKNTLRDVVKKLKAESINYRVIYFWESDLKKFGAEALLKEIKDENN